MFIERRDQVISRFLNRFHVTRSHITASTDQRKIFHQLLFLTELFSRTYSSLLSSQIAFPFPLKCSRWPNWLIQPICFAGLPTTNAYAGTGFVTTAPAPMKA